MMLALHCPASTHTSLPPFLHYLGSGQRSTAPAKGVKEILSKLGHLSKKPELTGSLIFLQPINSYLLDKFPNVMQNDQFEVRTHQMVGAFNIML